MTVLDEYFETLDAPTRAVFEHIRSVVWELAPEAEPGTSYGMVALKYRGKGLLGFLAARAHLSLFPFSPAAIDAVRGQLSGFDLAKGTIRFSAAAPVPDEVVRDLVRHRLAEIAR